MNGPAVELFDRANIILGIRRDLGVAVAVDEDAEEVFVEPSDGLGTGKGLLDRSARQLAQRRADKHVDAATRTFAASRLAIVHQSQLKTPGALARTKRRGGTFKG